MPAGTYHRQMPRGIGFTDQAIARTGGKRTATFVDGVDLADTYVLWLAGRVPRRRDPTDDHAARHDPRRPAARATS